MPQLSFPFSDKDIIALAAGETASFDLASGGHWYGHGFSHVQPYPLENGSVVNANFAVNNIQSPIWLCSAGCAIFAETNAPLDVRINENNDGLLRVSCPRSALKIRLFKGANLPEAQAALMRHLGWPNKIPSSEIFGDSFFCTWTQYPRCITQSRIIDMARQIRSHKYPCSTLIIDDRWESCFGELSFSKDFPDPKAMMDELHRLGFKAWLWVTPFVNQEAAGFAELAEKRILVPHKDNGGAALFKWWGGTAGLVDLTGAAGRNWYMDKLLALRNIGVDGFKIDGGDFKYQPSPAEAAWADFKGASGYSDVLLSIFEEIAPNQCETRTAWLSQKRQIIWREGGKDSHWGLDNGLKAMVALGIHLGLVGYDILMPDMIPGRVQTMVSDMPLPTDELMVRWTEASTFFPLVQFSYLPWNYSSETEAAVNAYAQVHKALQDYIVAHSVDRSAPLLRPIWYGSPEQKELYAVADEFMLGPDLLAAPVLDPGVNFRDIVLPPGKWIDAWTGKNCEGPIKNYPAPCPGIPVFVRAGNKELAAVLRDVLSKVERGSVPGGITTTKYVSGLDRDLNVTG